MRIWDNYFYGPVAAVRPYVLMKTVLLLLSFDMWFTMTKRAAFHGATDFNISHFKWLDALQSTPTTEYHTTFLLFTGLLSMIIALVGVSRMALTVLWLCYSYCWAMSRLDSFTHHYFLSLVLLALIFFPKIKGLDITTHLRSGRSPRTSAWAYTMLGTTAGVIFFYCAMAKIDAPWRSGHTILSMEGARAFFGPIERLVGHLGMSRSIFWNVAGSSVIFVELAIAVAYPIAVSQDRSRRRGLVITIICWVGWILTIGLHINNEQIGLNIRWLSYYFMLISCVYFLPERWLAMVARILVMPSQWLGQGFARHHRMILLLRSFLGVLVMAMMVTGLLCILGNTLDLPGAPTAYIVIGVGLIVVTTIASWRGAAALAYRQMIAVGIAGAAMWIVIANSSIRCRYYETRGDHMQLLNQPDEALIAFTKARRYLPEGNDQAHFDVANGFYAVGNIIDAMSLFRRVIEIAPDRVDARNNLGSALRKQGRAMDAIQHYRDALQLDPSYVSVLYNLASTWQEQGDYEKAMVWYKHLLRVDPRHAPGHIGFGGILQRRGRINEAMQHYLEALKYEPENGRAHNNLGATLRLLGQFDKAIEHLKKAVRIKPDHMSAQYNLANVLFYHMGQVELAVLHYRTAAELAPCDPLLHLALARALQADGQINEAVLHYRQTLALDPDSAEAKGRLYELLGTQSIQDVAP